jgi:nitrile hydratase accessory protein
VVLEAVENTDDVHNLVVCTLCSCYPWAVLGLPPTWYKSEAYRARAVREPRTLLRQDFGLDLGGEVDVRVWDSTSELRYFVVPQRPPGTEGFEEDDLVELVTRDAMIGVDRLTEPPASDGGVRPRSAAATFGVDLDREPTFRAPWQARAFAVAVALADDAYDWDAFQGRLVAETERAAAVDDPGEGGPGGDPDAAESAYYERWLSALEATLVDRGLLVPETLRARAAEFEAGDRTAEEFVEGDRHHTHGEGDGHGRGHGDHHGHGHGHEHRDHQGGGGHHDHDHDHDDRGHRHDR